MNKEELEKVFNNIQLQMIGEQNTGYRSAYSYSLQDKINLYNYVIDLKQALNEIRNLCNSNMVAWDNEGDCGVDCCVDGFGILQIIDKYMKED